MFIYIQLTPSFTFLFQNPDDVVEVLNCCLTAIAKWLKANKLKLNPDMTEMLLVGKADVLKDLVLPTFDADLIKTLEIILDPALLLKKQVTVAAKNVFF